MALRPPSDLEASFFGRFEAALAEYDALPAFDTHGDTDDAVPALSLEEDRFEGGVSSSQNQDVASAEVDPREQSNTLERPAPCQSKRRTAGAPLRGHASMVTHGPSALRGQVGGHYGFGSLPRCSPSGTMPHHQPRATARCAAKRRPGSASAQPGSADGEAARGSGTAGRRVLRGVPPEGANSAPQSGLERSAFGARAKGTLQFKYAPTVPRLRPPRHGREVPGSGFDVLEVVECCGEPFEGYCCKRHHPDDAIICCKRHQPSAPACCGLTAAMTRAQLGTPTPGLDRSRATPRTQRTFTFPRAGAAGPFRATAIVEVPRGHALGAREPGRKEAVPRWRAYGATDRFGVPDEPELELEVGVP